MKDELLIDQGWIALLDWILGFYARKMSTIGWSVEWQAIAVEER